MNVRISDYDALWMDDYDTIYMGILKLDDDTYIHKYPLWVVKSSEQFKIVDYEEIYFDFNPLTNKWTVHDKKQTD